MPSCKSGGERTLANHQLDGLAVEDDYWSNEALRDVNSLAAPSRLKKSLMERSGRRCGCLLHKRSRVGLPTPLVEIATITARGLAGQPMKCGSERARLAEADIKRNGSDGQLMIRQ
jgi:hypothetical protein